jgi:hypothetical protein
VIEILRAASVWALFCARSHHHHASVAALPAPSHSPSLPTPQEHYKTGLTYNGKGGEFADGLKAYGGGSGAAAAPAPAAAAPAPAPAAPAATNGAAAPPSPAPATAAGGKPANMAGLFAQISSIDQSSGRTAGLR